MKKTFLLFALLITASASFAQTANPQQVAAVTHAYMNAGDTVGLYSFSEDKPQLMEPIKYTGIKMNTLGAALSYGIAKSKMKMEFAGTTSPYVFTGKAHFLLYFGIVPANKAVRYYMFSNNFSIRDFAVAKFSVKKNKRLLVQGSYSLWSGSNTGLKTDDDVKITSKQIRDGVYDITVSALPGEYCFVFTNNGVGAFNSVFDFTIK